jgi:hypothetical protein
VAGKDGSALGGQSSISEQSSGNGAFRYAKGPSGLDGGLIMINAILAGIRILGRSPVGRIVVRLARQLTRQGASRAATNGVIRSLGRNYSQLSAGDKWVADQIIDFASQVCMNYVEGDIEIHIDEDQLVEYIDRYSISLEEAFIRALQAKQLSVGYDFAFGSVGSDGRILVSRNIIKNTIIAAVTIIDLPTPATVRGGAAA